MAQLVDLGTQSFRASRLNGQCLVSRATATLIHGDNTNSTELNYHRINFQSAWITLKQELIVDLYIEAYPDPVMSVPSFVKQVVETVQASLISDNPYLRVSAIHHEYRSLGDSVALHVSVVLSKVPDLSPRILPKRLPRRVRECAAEPHPPPETDRATLSHIAIYMKTLGQCTPWSLFLTNLWLRQPHDKPFLDDSQKDHESSNQKSNIITLRPPRTIFPIPASRETAYIFHGHRQNPISGGNYVQHTDNVLKHDESKLVKQYTDLSEMVDRSLWWLVNGNSQQHKDLVNKSTIEEGPTLSDVAPTFFKPGHYENIRQRAGLMPVVTRSIATILRACQSSSAKEKMRSVKSNLRSRYGTCTDIERTDVGHLSRSLIKCVAWTALQRGTYKVEWPKKSIRKNTDTILLSDDYLLTEYSDQYKDSDGQMLNSSISSETGSDDILSHCDDGIEPDSGYSSLSSPEKLFPRFSKIDSLDDEIHDESTSGESAIDNGESDLIAPPDTEGKDIIRSSSLPPAASDMVAGNDMTDQHWSSEASNQNGLDICENQHDRDMMDDSSAMSILSCSTYQCISEDFEPELEFKFEHDETEGILMTI